MPHPFRTPSALICAALVGAMSAVFVRPAAPGPTWEQVADCQAVVWNLQRAGFRRDESGSVIPIDLRPDLTALGTEISAKIDAAIPLDEGESKAFRLAEESGELDARRAAVEALSAPELERRADRCKSELG